MPHVQLQGRLVTLRPAREGDVRALSAIRESPAVWDRWGGDDIEEEVRESIDDPELGYLAVLLADQVVGAIQWSESDDPMYRHAGIDIFLSEDVQGQGLGTEAVRTMAEYLIRERGHHRLVIDPAAHNTAAIRAYEKAGFKPVGVMRQYERLPGGEWHDGLLMDLLADEL